MLAFVPWLVFLHTLSAITFFLAHGTSAAMAFRLRKETDFARISAMLDLSSTTMMVLFFAFLAMGITGLILPFMLGIWNKIWIWLSIVLMVFVFFWMMRFNDSHYKRLRKLVGIPYMVGGKEFPAEPPASQEQVNAHIASMNVTTMVAVGYVIPAFVLWLMVFKPF